VARIVAPLVFVVAVASMANAANVDWKMYGTATAEDQETVCFYDASSVVRSSDERIRVWTKCLLQTDLDSAASQGELGARIVENAARKLLNGYVPPIAIVEDINFDQATVIMGYEETANIGDLRTNAQFLYELDCSDRKIRRLSIHVRIQGKDVFDEKQSDWQYTPPETNGARLLTMLCPRR
jgi:hypothetical protein